MGNILYPKSRLEQIAYATVLIQTEHCFGTGFVLQKDLENKKHFTLLVTNKHIICGFDTKKQQYTLSENGKLTFHTMDNNQKPSGRVTNILFEKDFGKLFIQHPDSDVDLCAMNISPFINGKKIFPPEIFLRSIHTTLIPTEEDLKNLDYMEDIIMMGYPQALRDNVHNYPIIRKGITATHPFIDFNGKKEFLADIAIYGGSSGSPVFLLKRNYLDKDDHFHKEGLFYFMGVAYAVETANTFVDEKEKTKLIEHSNVRTTMNIAHIIKSGELFKLLDLFK